jgi:predicted RNase H-like HicB family nuclease
MLTAYIKAAMKRAKYEILKDDGTFYGEIPALKGVWANAKTLEACRDELEEVVEGWILLGLRFNDPLPILDGIDLNVKAGKRIAKAS